LPYSLRWGKRTNPVEASNDRIVVLDCESLISGLVLRHFSFSQFQFRGEWIVDIMGGAPSGVLRQPNVLTFKRVKPMSEQAYTLIVEVVDIQGHCPVYRVGDSFRIEEASSW